MNSASVAARESRSSSMSHAAPIVFVVDDVSEITVKAHRGRMMQKMKADSLPALVNMVTRLRLAPAHKG